MILKLSAILIALGLFGSPLLQAVNIQCNDFKMSCGMNADDIHCCERLSEMNAHGCEIECNEESGAMVQPATLQGMRLAGKINQTVLLYQDPEDAVKILYVYRSNPVIYGSNQGPPGKLYLALQNVRI